MPIRNYSGTTNLATSALAASASATDIYEQHPLLLEPSPSPPQLTSLPDIQRNPSIQGARIQFLIPALGNGSRQNKG
jgi:hypothetical protein